MSKPKLNKKKNQHVKHVAIVVIGDIGRSPRMQYHAISLASENNTKVDIIGYKGVAPHPLVSSNPNIRLVYVKEFPALPRILFPIYAMMKVLWQIMALLWMMMVTINRPHFILVQNPPAVPALIVVKFVAICRGAKLVVDWHNLGYTILALNKRAPKILVDIYRWVEKTFGKSADYHLCVTQALKNMLISEWKFSANTIHVLYDRPPSIFQPLSPQQRVDFLLTWSESLSNDKMKEDVLSTLGVKNNKNNRSALLISSTSWTADEDFSILLKALIAYDASARSDSSLPYATVIITGSGPLKKYYMQKIDELELKKVGIYTAWLESEDYPKIIAAADLGICLHTSSSKLDLPMKVVDMLGTGLPVCAINEEYPVLHELLLPKYGIHFKTTDELSVHLEKLLAKFPEKSSLTKYRENITQDLGKQFLNWDRNWTRSVSHVFA